MTLRFPRRTARLRLTALYGGLFLLSGVALVASTYVLFERATAAKTPHLPKIPQTPAIHRLKPPTTGPPLSYALPQLKQVQDQLTKTQQQLKQLPRTPGGRPGSLLGAPSLLVRDEHQLTRGQHRLTHAVQQLAEAEHHLSQASSVQAAQRASDSHELLVDSGIALGIVALLAVLAGWLIAGRMLRPIRTITHTARRISSTNLHERLAFGGPEDELKDLGDTLDDLFARLEAAFQAQRRFVAHASHELRTPLTRERALVQVALGDPATTDVWRSTGQELLVSNRAQETLIDALLTLASSESGIDHREPVDLSLIARSVLRERRDSDRQRLQIDTTLKSAPFDGDRRLVERLVANLVDNAIGHNIEGGNVEISTGVRDGDAVLTVTNTGPLIPPAEVDRLFQPFQRLDRGRAQYQNGHGLGLSIVRAIATAHQASIVAHPLPDGGLTVSVMFPQPTNPERTAASSSQSDGHSTNIKIATP